MLEYIKNNPEDVSVKWVGESNVPVRLLGRHLRYNAGWVSACVHILLKTVTSNKCYVIVYIHQHVFYIDQLSSFCFTKINNLNINRYTLN